jgi:hemerythrin-like domain-containing protein
MLTGLIKERFFKHHGELLAYMDAIEEVVQEIFDSPDPADRFQHHRARLDQLFQFLHRWEAQHEQEEERILLPLLQRQLEAGDDPASIESLKRVGREHVQGQEMVRDLSKRLDELESGRLSEPAEFYKFSVELNALVWHFRRHVWSENELILPTAEKLIPDSADRLWTHRNDTAPAEEPTDE